MKPKKAATACVINTNPTYGKQGRLVLRCRTNDTLLFNTTESNLSAVILDSETGAAVAPAAGTVLRFKTQKNGTRLVISFNAIVPSQINPQSIIDTTGTGVFTDAFLCVTLTDSSLAGAQIVTASMSSTPTTVTIVTSAPHNFNVGDTVVIASVSVGGSTTNTYNGTFTVASVIPPTAPSTASTSFTYTLLPGTTAPASDGSGGTASPLNNVPVQQDIPVEYVNDPNAP